MPLLTWRFLPFDGFSGWVEVDNFAFLLLGSAVRIGVEDVDELDPVWLPSGLLEIRDRFTGKILGSEVAF